MFHERSQMPIYKFFLKVCLMLLLSMTVGCGGDGVTPPATPPATPQFVLTWGSQGTGDGQFASPDYIAVDGSGSVYVADRLNERIQKFDGTGTFLTQWGSMGTGDSQFSNPRGIAVDGSGNVYVAEEFNHRIQKFE